MRTLFLLAGGALTLAASPLFAQQQTGAAAADRPSKPLPYDLGRDNDSPRSDAVAAETAPGVAAANAEVAAVAPSGSAVAVDGARFAQDMAAYRTVVQARNQAAARDAAIYDRQQRAYATAMADWRVQVRACERGNSRACKAPTPDPTAY